MKLDNTVRRLLLVAADDSAESDLLAALKMSEVVQKSAGVFVLAFFCLQRYVDFLDILVLLKLMMLSLQWLQLRATTRFMLVCPTTCSVQWNGRRGAFHLLFFPVTEQKFLEFLSGRP